MRSAHHPGFNEKYFVFVAEFVPWCIMRYRAATVFWRSSLTGLTTASLRREASGEGCQDSQYVSIVLQCPLHSACIVLLGLMPGAPGSRC